MATSHFLGYLALCSLLSACPARANVNELIASGRYQAAADAITLMLRDTSVPGQRDENGAALMSNLGMVYDKLGRYSEAEALLLKATQAYRDLNMTTELNYARALNDLGSVYLNEQRYGKADTLFNDSLALYRRRPENNDQDIALLLNNLGLTRLSSGNPSEAERFFQESLELQRKLKQDTSRLAVTLNNVALACKHQKRYDDAALMYKQAIEVWRNTAGSAHPEVAVGLHNLATLETMLGQAGAAEKHFKEALSIVDATLPPDHPNRTAVMAAYAELLRKTGRKHEAKQLEASARILRTRHDHENFQDLTVDVNRLNQQSKSFR